MSLPLQHCKTDASPVQALPRIMPSPSHIFQVYPKVEEGWDLPGPQSCG